MACPHVAGLAALVLSHNPAFSNEEVRQVLHRGADDIESAGWDMKTGFGRINALKSLETAAVSVSYISSPHCGDTLSSTVAINGRAFGGNFASYALECGPGSEPQSWSLIAQSAIQIMDGVLGQWDTAYAADGYYTLRLTVNNGDGTTDRYLLSVTVKNTEITSPDDGDCVKAGTIVIIRGSSIAPSFQSYVLEWGKSNAYYWPSIWKTDGISLEHGGQQPVLEGTLGSFDTSVITAPGNYLLRLRTLSGAGESKDCSNLIIDPDLRDGWPQPFERSWAGIGSEAVRWSPNVADIDGDGRAEIFVDGLYNQTAGGDSVYSFDLDGMPFSGFNQPDYDIRWVPSLADLNGDGRCEVNGGRGPGAGYFSVFQHDKTVLSGWECNLPITPFTATADLDADGHLEIVGISSGSIYVLDDRGGVLPGWPLYFGTIWELPAVGDVDDDGYQEIAFVINNAQSPAQAAVYDYTGHPLPGWPLQLGDSSYRASPALCDIDGDQDLEIAVNDSQHVYVYHHDGQPAQGWPQAVAGIVTSPSAGDMDGDGRSELAITCSDAKAYLFNYRGELLPGWPRSMNESFSGDAFSNAALADVDGDGRAEVVVAASSLINNGTEYMVERCKIYAFTMEGQTLSGWPKVLKSYAEPMNTPALGDFDGDGLVEMIALGSGFPYSELCVWELDSAYDDAGMPWPMHRHDSSRTAGGPPLIALPTRTPTETPTATPTPTRTPTRTPTPTPTAVPHIIVNQACPFTSPGEYVELYNNGSSQTNLQGWKLNVYQNDYIFSDSDIIPAHGFFLISDTSPVNGLTPDVTYDINISDNGSNSYVQLLNASSEVMDTVGWASSSLYEGTRLGTLGTNKVWKRVTDGFDTDNNSSDFSQVAPNPRNSSYHPPTATPTLTPTIIPTPTIPPTPTPWEFPRRINYQPAGAAPAPGYAVDDGSDYGPRGEHYYGWRHYNASAHPSGVPR